MLESTNQIFLYEGSAITFMDGDSIMVNATQMAKPFGKRPSGWLRHQQSQEFINELSNVRNRTYADLVQVKEGSSELGGGTWLHEDVAIEFARWLSPAFAIWCNDRIKELMKDGVTTIADDTPEMIMAKALQVAQMTIEKHQHQLSTARATITIDFFKKICT